MGHHEQLPQYIKMHRYFWQSQYFFRVYSWLKSIFTVNAHGMVYITGTENENCFSRKGAKNIFFVYFVYFVCFVV